MTQLAIDVVASTRGDARHRRRVGLGRRAARAVVPCVFAVLVLASHPAAQLAGGDPQARAPAPRAQRPHERLIAEGRFGSSVAAIGDLDGDGHVDVAIGAPDEPGGGVARGVVRVAFLDGRGQAREQVAITSARGGFTGELDDFDAFGWAVASLGDLDGDGVVDVAVGAPRDDDGAVDAGAVWILFLTREGTVKSHAKLTAVSLAALTGVPAGANDSGAGTPAAGFDWLGVSLASLGDLDGDGPPELAVGAFGDGTASRDGAVCIVSLNGSGGARACQRIDAGFAASLPGRAGAPPPKRLDSFDLFGYALAAAGDVNGDGTPDLAVGSSTGGTDRFGFVWMLYLAPDGSPHSFRRNRAPQDGVQALMRRLGAAENG